MTTGFAERYGPWALVAGAADGVGSAFARELARRGVNVVLLARRQAMLDEVASAIRAASGVATRTVAVDLATTDAMARVRESTAGLELDSSSTARSARPTWSRTRRRRPSTW